jgi:hypothetical protein
MVASRTAMAREATSTMVGPTPRNNKNVQPLSSSPLVFISCTPPPPLAPMSDAAVVVIDISSYAMVRDGGKEFAVSRGLGSGLGDRGVLLSFLLFFFIHGGRLVQFPWSSDTLPRVRSLPCFLGVFAASLPSLMFM